MTKVRREQARRADEQIKRTPSAAPSTQQEHPVFSLIHVDAADCITKCDNEDIISFVRTIRTLSQMTWQEINAGGRHGSGSETISQKAIKRRRMPEVVREDTTLIALRYNGNKPMVGFRDGAVFHIIWFDRDLKLYNHG